MIIAENKENGQNPALNVLNGSVQIFYTFFPKTPLTSDLPGDLRITIQS